MKRLMLLCFIAIHSLAFAQQGNLVFFSENGERFTVIINGQRRNDTPETNVKVSGLNPAAYIVKFIFDDQSIPEIDEKIYATESTERTFAIRRKKVSSTEKGLKKTGVNLGRQIEGGDKEDAAAKKEAIEASEYKYVVKLVSESPVQISNTGSMNRQENSNSNRSQNSNTNDGVQYNQQIAVGTETSQQHTSTQTSVNTTTNATSTTSSQSVNVSEGQGVGISMNVNITETNSTTTTGTNQTDMEHGHHEPTVDHHNTRCSFPMNDRDFESAKKSIADKSFSDSQLTMAKQIVKSNCMSSAQIKQLMLIFSFEETRLDLAKYAYKYVVDPGNYFKVNDAFTFESSIEELNEYMESAR